MKKLSLSIIAISVLLFSCQEDDEANAITPSNDETSENIEAEVQNEVSQEEVISLETQQFSNLFAPVDQEAVRDRTTGQQIQDETGAFIKFDLETGTITDSEDDWDIAFRTTAIIVNGGEVTGVTDEPERTQNGEIAIVEGLFDNIDSISEADFKQDSAEGGFAIVKRSDAGWYNYNFMTNTVTPIPGKIILVKTSEGNYAKVEILSYYKDNPAEITDEIRSEGVRYYTFRYAVTTGGSGNLTTN